MQLPCLQPTITKITECSKLTRFDANLVISAVMKNSIFFHLFLYAAKYEQNAFNQNKKLVYKLKL